MAHIMQHNGTTARNEVYCDDLQSSAYGSTLFWEFEAIVTHQVSLIYLFVYLCGFNVLFFLLILLLLLLSLLV